MLPAPEALERLRQGNARFVARLGSGGPGEGVAAAVTLDSGHAPNAIILGCSDGRVPPEIIFDQGLGDLFVIRVAGNVAEPTQIGSIEYGAVKWGARLIVVLGHTECGAISTTVGELLNPVGALSEAMRSVVESVRPAVEPLMTLGLASGRENLEERATRANVVASVKALRRDPVLAGLCEREGMVVVGAVYSLATGAVDFLDIP